MTGQRSGKADPDCKKCGGRGVEVETHGVTPFSKPWHFTMVETLCTCTNIPDPTAELSELEAWESETPE